MERHYMWLLITRTMNLRRKLFESWRHFQTILLNKTSRSLMRMEMSHCILSWKISTIISRARNNWQDYLFVKVLIQRVEIVFKIHLSPEHWIMGRMRPFDLHWTIIIRLETPRNINNLNLLILTRLEENSNSRLCMLPYIKTTLN